MAKKAKKRMNRKKKIILAVIFIVLLLLIIISLFFLIPNLTGNLVMEFKRSSSFFQRIIEYIFGRGLE